jgi:MFS family permease
MFALDGYLDIVCCFITGSLIHEDRLGLRKTMILFSLFLVIGNGIFALSANLGIYWLALLGRVLAGVGIECQNVTYYALLSQWFGERDHGIATSASVICIRLGMMFSGFIVPLLQEKTGMLEVPFAFATGCAFIGLFAAGAVCFIDGHNAT